MLTIFEILIHQKVESEKNGLKTRRLNDLAYGCRLPVKYADLPNGSRKRMVE